MWIQCGHSIAHVYTCDTCSNMGCRKEKIKSICEDHLYPGGYNISCSWGPCNNSYSIIHIIDSPMSMRMLRITTGAGLELMASRSMTITHGNSHSSVIVAAARRS